MTAVFQALCLEDLTAALEILFLECRDETVPVSKLPRIRPCTAEPRGTQTMYPLVFSYPTLAVSAIYCIWHAYLRCRVQQDRKLHERVAFLLWTMVGSFE